MGRGNTASRLVRLDDILGRLKTGDPYTSASLANELNVSVRTLMRDIELLRDKGYPIESEKGRGGGIRLYPRYGVGRLTMNYREVIDLLLALSILEKMDSPLFLSNLNTVRNKLFASFPDAQRPQIQKIRERILVGEQASKVVMSNYQGAKQDEMTSAILQSFFESKRMVIKYVRADGEVSTREIEVHYLFLNWPVWYLVAWDHFRDSPRTFRIDRVMEISPLETHFSLRSLGDFAEELRQFSTPL